MPKSFWPHVITFIGYKEIDCAFNGTPVACGPCVKREYPRVSLRLEHPNTIHSDNGDIEWNEEWVLFPINGSFFIPIPHIAGGSWRSYPHQVYLRSFLPFKIHIYQAIRFTKPHVGRRMILCTGPAATFGSRCWQLKMSLGTIITKKDSGPSKSY